jgi:hypothetical protein
LTAISALGAVIAAIGAFLSARATRNAAEGHLVSSFLNEYASPDMLRHLRVLRNWKSEKEGGFEEKWRKALESAESEALRVDQARRYVKNYFLKALRLYESGYVTETFLKQVTAVDGINIIYDIVEPLEYALNPAYDKDRFEKLRQLCGRSRTGRLIRPIPCEAADKKIES